MTDFCYTTVVVSKTRPRAVRVVRLLYSRLFLFLALLFAGTTEAFLCIEDRGITCFVHKELAGVYLSYHSAAIITSGTSVIITSTPNSAKRRASATSLTVHVLTAQPLCVAQAIKLASTA